MDKEQYWELLSKYRELIGCTSAEIFNPFDGNCYPRDSPIGKALSNILAIQSSDEHS